MWWLLLIVLFLTIIILSLWLHELNENYNLLAMCPRIKPVDGSRLEDKICVIPGLTIFGNNFDLIKLNMASIFQYCRRNNIYAKGKSYIKQFVFHPVYNITNAEDAEELLLNSTTLLTKSLLYELVRPFLGDGLLISKGEKWHMRRKLLTPAFHFNVLKSFNEIFKEESIKLLTKLQHLRNDQIDLIDIISEFTLNNVCETALGVKLDNIGGSSEYRKIIHDIEVIIIQRLCNILMGIPLIFYLFGPYTKNRNCLKIAHDFSSQIIVTKRREYLMKQKENVDRDEVGIKKRYAMLDTLLDEEFKGHIDHQGICDEVNTFMFEGYDTTSICLIFSILNLALHSDVQDKCRREIQSAGDFSSLSVFDFNKFEYLECVLKETLRLYPSVPVVVRRCSDSTQLNNLIFPKNTQIVLHIYDIMRDSKHFPEPLAFKPERFLAENAIDRHPFAFVPFSAGSRNCIGQKFAILEMKAVLVAILRNFQILPVTRMDDLTFENGIVLRTQQKIYVKLKKLSQ